METPIPGHSERDCKCAKVHDSHRINGALSGDRICPQLLKLHEAVDEWTVAGRVDSGMPVKESSELIAARA
eukprot:scaffold9686_cov170-Skeletonema_menzelii.AAC.1